MVIFNGINSSTFNLRILNIERKVTADMRASTTRKNNGDGEFYHTSYLDTREFEIEFAILDTNSKFELYERITEIASWLYSNDRQPKELRFFSATCGEPEFVYYAYPEGDFDVEEILMNGTFEVTFICYDPYKYKSDITYTVNGNGDTTINSLATAESNGVLTYTSSSTQASFRIEHVEKGEFINLEREITSGDILIIDFIKRYITINGNNSMAYLDIDSTFFSLSKGINTLRVQAINIDNSSFVVSPKYF